MNKFMNNTLAILFFIGGLVLVPYTHALLKYLEGIIWSNCRWVGFPSGSPIYCLDDSESTMLFFHGISLFCSLILSEILMVFFWFKLTRVVDKYVKQ